LSYNDTQVTGATTYYYVVKAFNVAGQSTSGNEVYATPYGPLLQVTLHELGSSTSSYGLQVDLSWSRSTQSGVTAYKVYRETSPNVTEQDTLALTVDAQNAPNNPVESYDYNVTPTPTPGTTYYYRVFVYDQWGQSTGSNEESLTLIDALPAAVTLLNVEDGSGGSGSGGSGSGGSNSVHLTWTRSYENDISSYKIYRATHANVTEADTLIATIDDQYASGDPLETYDYNVPASLPPGTTYYYRVFVYDESEQSAGSNEESILRIAPPLTPGTPSFSDVTMTTLKATTPVLPEGATSLTLQKKLSSQFDSEYVDVAANLAGDVIMDVTGLEGSTDYMFRVVAVGPGGSTIGPGAGVRTDELPPEAPEAPTFSELTNQSVKVHAPELSVRAEWLRLQGKLSSQPDSAYADIAYTFRYVAVGTGGYTPGAPASLVTPMPFYFWEAHNSISCGGIRWPVTGANSIAPGASGMLSSFLATDWDKRDARILVNGQQSVLSSKVMSDTCTYTWSASSGVFPAGNTGQSVKWIAPTVPGTYTLTLVVDDVGGANQPGDEVGARNDAALGYNDDPLRFSVSVTVAP
jgi:hypothetical protein